MDGLEGFVAGYQNVGNEEMFEGLLQFLVV